MPGLARSGLRRQAEADLGGLARGRAAGRIWVKVCGLTREEEARRVAASGVDAVGFILDAGPRRVEPKLLGALSRGWPEQVARVGVFTSTPPAEVVELARRLHLDVVQLHGGYAPEDCARVAQELGPRRVLYALRLREGAQEDLGLARLCLPWVGGFLLEPRVDGLLGGSGVRLPGRLVEAARRSLGPEVGLLLAGGLNPENVAEAVLTLPVDGVDASSGLEKAVGRKDLEKVRSFVERARRAAAARAAGPLPAEEPSPGGRPGQE
ncbi:MAG: phosphoribosylanthranilate isomerase [Bacillota bacterium]|nr:phosphoribosylanthranilate isomerase [Bacillota bacterium]